MLSMYDQDERIKKANKTIAVLKDYLKEISTLTLLDIGSSTGIMTNEYAKHFKNVIVPTVYVTPQFSGIL